MVQTSVTVLMNGAIDAVKARDVSGADALFRDYVASMAGSGPHSAVVEKDLPVIEKAVAQTLAAEANNGNWYAQLDPATSEQVSALFAQLRQAAARIEEIEKPERDPAKIGERIDRDLAALQPLMEQIYGVFNALGEMGMGQAKYDEKVLAENVGSFRALRRQAAEIIVPLEKQTEHMNPDQKKAYEKHRGDLMAMIREVIQGMGLAG
jgi:hypothetical protein